MLDNIQIRNLVSKYFPEYQLFFAENGECIVWSSPKQYFGPLNLNELQELIEKIFH